MNTEIFGHRCVAENSPSPAVAPRAKSALRALAIVIAGASLIFGVDGCADGYLGVSTYPDYSPYYGYYGYGGLPYYGYGGIYTRNIVIRGRRHSGGYGRHHFSRSRGNFGGGRHRGGNRRNR